MKTLYSILSLTIIGLLSSCSTTQDLSYKDDIYSEEESYLPTVNSNSEFDEYYSYEEEASQVGEDEYYDPKYSEIESDDAGNTYVTNNYYNTNYDYQYSSRIRRFNYCNSGYNYYNPWFTNSYYYGSPYGWNTNIYYGNYYSGYANNSYYNNCMNCCSNNNYWNNYGCNNYGYGGYGYYGNNYNGYYGNGWNYYGNGYGNNSNYGNYYGEQTAANSYSGNHGGGMSSNSLTGSNYGNSSSEDYNNVTAIVKKINPAMNGSENSNTSSTATTTSNTSVNNSKEIGSYNVLANSMKVPSYDNSLSSLSNNNKFENHDLNATRTTPTKKGNSNYISREPASINNSRGTSSAWKTKPSTTNTKNFNNGASRPNNNNYTRPSNNSTRPYNASKPNNSYTRPSTTKPNNNRYGGSSSTYKPSSNSGSRSSAGSSRSSSSPSRSSGRSSGSSRSKGSSSSSKSGGRR